MPLGGGGGDGNRYTTYQCLYTNYLLSFSYLGEVSILYFADEDMGSSEALVALSQATVGRAKTGKEVCLKPNSMLFALPAVLLLAIF